MKYPFYLRLASILLSLVLIFLILNVAKGIVIPLTFSLLISILLYPATVFMEEKLHFGKSLAAMFSVLFCLVLIGSFIYFFSIQFINFADDFPELKNRFVNIIDSIQHWLSSQMHITSRQQSDYLNKAGVSILESAAYSLSNILNSLSTIFIYIIFIFIFTFFMLYHRSLLKKFLLHLFKLENRDKVNDIAKATKSLINGYISALLIEMMALTIIISTMFMITGIKYALLLGLMTAVLNVIPYIGIYSSIVVCMLVTFASSTGNVTLIIGAELLVVHLIDANVFIPRLVGNRVKMNPFITILAVMIGEFTWGVSGMLLFIPLIGILKLVCERVEGLEAWGILIGVDEKLPKAAKKKNAEKH